MRPHAACSLHFTDMLAAAQMPFNAVGVKFGGKRRFPILQQMSGVLKPVSSLHC